MSQRERLQSFEGNGPKVQPTFSAAEMQRRQDAIRAYMAAQGIDAALFTSYHGINYYSDFLYCQFGRRYGFLIDHDKATSISAGIDGGQPWRRTFGNNVTYTDWQKDNYFHAVLEAVKSVSDKIRGKTGLSEDGSALVEGQLAEASLSDGAGILDRTAEVDALAADARDLLARRRVAHDGRIDGGIRRPPHPLQVAGQDVGHQSLHS